MAVRIPVLPDIPSGGTTTRSSGGGSSSSGGGSRSSGGGSRSSGGGSSSSGGGSSSSGGGSSTPSWIKQQRADQKKAERKAAQKYSQQAKRLKQQADALRVALGKNGYRKRLSTQIANVRLQFQEQDALILEGYARGREELERQAETNDDSFGRGTTQALGNAGRERAEALSQVVQQGAGLTDSLRAQAASLRNWHFNQTEVQEGYTDTLNSLNSAEAEMVNMVSAQRQGAFRQREEQITTLRNNYFDDRSRTLVDVGNKLGEAASYWGMANESQGSKLRRNSEKRLQKQANKAFRQASRATGEGRTELETPDRITEWEGRGEFTAPTDSRRYAIPQYQTAEAEGATLRRWET